MNGSRELFRVRDPLFDLAEGWEGARELLRFVDLGHLLGEVLGVPSGELDHGVDPRGFEELGELFAHAVDSEEVGHVDEREDLLL